MQLTNRALKDPSDGKHFAELQVEYHDPAGVFPLVSRNIAARLPLRNLNWHSPPRPLRQIKQLHLDFVPDADTRESLQSGIVRPDSGEQSSLDIVRGGPDARKHASKERRHQIPGFRTSPYLKIFILRCDDKDTYKGDARRKIREWIKETAQSEVKRDDHDAFEWMILHVVIPDTIAASEPRWRESVRDPDELKERKAGSKIIGKSVRTVFDRLRADFNESGKLGQDRVAQIRLPKDQVPADLLPTPAIAQTLVETQQERDNAWNHLISKFKTLILEPFDRRVRQYEADIAEQESRRSLPGWNFCTFFIHKEGLAKALESIGLVEDALAIYDELLLALETAIREVATGQAQGTATSFGAYTEDIEERIANLPGREVNGSHEAMKSERRDAAALFTKDYRERIVMSTISVFDFFCYVFVRQKALILRLANARSIRVELGVDANREGGEDLVLTSEVCWRASSFIHTAARTLRQDLANRSANNHNGPDEVEIEGLVDSWIFAVAGQILDETAAPALLEITQHSRRGSSTVPGVRVRRPTLTIGLGANTHPQRTTSLPISRVKTAELQRPHSEDRSNMEDGSKGAMNLSVESTTSVGIPGQAELATYRAELLLMRRKMLEQLARRRGWSAGWVHAKQRPRTSLVETDINNAARDSVVEEQTSKQSIPQSLGPTLICALQSKAAFWDLYERLTNEAIRHYYTATQSKSAETLLGDLAILEYQRSNYESAASYFEHILPLLASDEWNPAEVEAMVVYADCLRQLRRLETYVETSLVLLTKLVGRRADQRLPRIRWDSGCTFDDSDSVPALATLKDVIAASTEISHDVVQPIKDFFADVRLDCELIHDSASDAYWLPLHIRHVLHDAVTLDQIAVKLINFHDSCLEVTLKTESPVTLVQGSNRIRLRSTTNVHGPFLIDRIMLSAKRISFVEELRPPPEPTPLGFTEIRPPTVTTREPEKPPAFVFLYPAARALWAEVRRSPSIHIDRARGLEIRLDAGQNQVEALQVKLKPISAGLRLHLSDATSTGIEASGDESGKSGQLSFQRLNTGTHAIVTIPYTVEQADQDIAVRLELHFRTAAGSFSLLQSIRVTNALPLDVEVNDIFHHDALFSHFIIRTTTPLPLSLLRTDLKDSPVYAVQQPPVLPLPSIIYKSQPLSLIHKITRKPKVDRQVIKRDAALALRVCYQPLDEMYLDNLRRAFAQKLVESPYHALYRLLVPTLLGRARQLITSADLEVAALLGEAKTPSYDAVGWEETVNTLGTTLRDELRLWLHQWHAEHPTMALLTNDDQTLTQDLTISVDVPNIDMVFTVGLNPIDIKPAPALQPPVLVLGQPIQARLKIKCSGHWSARSIFPNVPTFKIQGEDDQKPTFACNVATSDPDIWIVGGRRKFQFTPTDEMDHNVGVVLIPLRLGTWHLPSVEIQQNVSHPEAADSEHEPTSISCETHYENAAQLVQVVRDQRVSKVLITESPASVALPPSRPGTASTRDAG